MTHGGYLLWVSLSRVIKWWGETGRDINSLWPGFTVQDLSVERRSGTFWPFLLLTWNSLDSCFAVKRLYCNLLLCWAFISLNRFILFALLRQTGISPVGTVTSYIKNTWLFLEMRLKTEVYYIFRDFYALMAMSPWTISSSISWPRKQRGAGNLPVL